MYQTQSEHEGELLILFLEISVRNTHLCMEAYKKRSKWAQLNSKDMDELLNNEGTVNKLYHIAIVLWSN